MYCPDCKKTNDTDALFCITCGRPLREVLQQAVPKQRKAYLAALLFVPVVVLAAGVGYYKFFLPDGVAALVNGEEINLSELDAAVARAQGGQGTASGRLRYQLLNQLIAQRIVLQEAHKAGISVSKEEIATAAAQARTASTLDDEAFQRQVGSEFGGQRAFEDFLERGLLMSKFFSVKVVPPGSDPYTAQIMINRWLEDATGRATVRIALAGQGAGPGCGCCNANGQEPHGRSKPGQGCATASRPKANDTGSVAAEAGLRYWHAMHGPDAVTARCTDFGCHVQVDILKNETIIGSLRYQDGNISEQ